MEIPRNMNALSEILSSRTRAEIFRLLFGAIEDELHVRELQRRSGLNDRTIRQELSKLVRLDGSITRVILETLKLKQNR